MDGGRYLERWHRAGLVDAATVARVRAFEAAQPTLPAGRLGAIAFGLGGLSLAAAIVLFVAAHWDELSPAARFALVLALVAACHAGAALARRLPALATTLHAVGTAALGAGIFLAGQIFNLGGDWPAALLLWSVGAAAGAVLIGDWPQVLWTAVLVPAWLTGEWLRRFEHGGPTGEPAAVLAAGLTLLSLAYLAAPRPGEVRAFRTALARLGALMLLPSVAPMELIGRRHDLTALPPLVQPFGVGWALAIGVPLAVAVWLRGVRGLVLLAAVPWLALLRVAAGTDVPAVLPYGLHALGAVALVVFGVRDRRTLPVNLGIVYFALTIGAFYFSNVFDRLGRAAGLAGLGVTFLVGGALLERVRRALVARIRSTAA